MATRILAIDDDPVLREMVTQALPSYDVEAVETAEAGLRSFSQAQQEKRPFELAIVDLRLPGMDGLEMIRRIRQEQPGAKVMVLSAYGTPENLLGSLRQNVVDFLVKPFDPIDLQYTVENLLEHEQAIEVISAMPHWIELHVPASFQVAASLRKVISRMQIGLDAATLQSIGAVFLELMNNAIEHGAHGDGRKKIRVSFVRLARAIIYRIDDPGKGFDLAAPSPLADEIVYDEHRNKVMFVKYLAL